MASKGEEVEVLTEKIAAVELSDPYRLHMYEESEKKTVWRHGGPPTYNVVNSLFEQGRKRFEDYVQVWPKGSLDETVQNLVKTWEMELSHKTQIGDFKTIDPQNFSLIVNVNALIGDIGNVKDNLVKKYWQAWAVRKKTLELGSYNALLQTSLPEELQYYKTSKETFESSHDIFRTAFPGGFAWEVLEVYTGPPVVNFKFRHWGVMEGPFKGHAPTGKTVEFTGIAIAKVDEKLRMGEVEVYYDPAELCGGLLQGPLEKSYGEYKTGIEGCPFHISSSK